MSGSRWKAIAWKVITWSVPVLTFVYGFGTYCGLWDSISGRRSLQAAYDRLRSSKGYPIGFIFAGDPEFPELLKWSRRHGTGPDFVANLKNGHVPTLFTRGGGGEVATPMPPGEPPFVFVPESSPILAGYNYTHEARENSRAAWCASLADLSGFIAQSRQREQFLVTTILIGALSLLLAGRSARK